MAQYLYGRSYPEEHTDSAGIQCGERLNDRANDILVHWGIDVVGHRPKTVTRELCDGVDAVFLMSPEHLKSMLDTLGMDLATKSYLFADPFSMPESFAHGEYVVGDPSFDTRPASELAAEFDWFKHRVAQIHESLENGSDRLIPASRYLHLLGEV
jgi:protein-tyrosine-phosphatase